MEPEWTGLLAGLALAVAGLVGWRWYDHSTTEAQYAASDLYESFLAAEGEARMALAERLDENIEGSAYQAFTLLHRAREAVGDRQCGGGIGLPAKRY